MIKKKKAQKFYKNVPGHKSERSLDDHVADFLETIMEMFFFVTCLGYNQVGYV